MAQHNRFVIRNDFSTYLTLCIEPEGAFFPLASGAFVSVSDSFTATPVTMKFTHSDGGDPILSLWPGDGDVRVELDGVDVLELSHHEPIQQG